MFANSVTVIQTEEFNHPNVDSLQEYDDGINLDEYKFEDMSLTPPLDAEDLQKLRYLYRYISQLYEQVKIFTLLPKSTDLDICNQSDVRNSVNERGSTYAFRLPVSLVSFLAQYNEGDFLV